MRGNWQIGSLLGIPLYIDSSWFLILALVTFVNGGDIVARGLAGDRPWLGWLAGFALALLLFGSVLLHELGHSLVARSQGITVNSITLFLFGGVAAIDRESKTPEGAFGVAIAGPIVSASLFVLFSLLQQGVASSQLAQYVITDLARINLVLAIFNLIPGLPLDGGQALKALVWKITGDRLKGVRWAAATGKFLGWLGIFLGSFAVLQTGQIGAIWIALVGWFILRNANAYDRLTVLQQALNTIPSATAATREFRVVKANLTLREFTEIYLLQDRGTFPTYYAASEGRYRGLIDPADVQKTERSEWDRLTLLDIARPFSEITSVTENAPLIQAILALESTSEPRITVLSPAGAVAGTIDRGDIVRAIATHLKIPIPESELKRIKADGNYPDYLPLASIVKSFQN